MRLLLGSIKINQEGLNYVFYKFYQWGIFYIGSIIGLIIAFIFIVLDVFYLKKKHNITRPYTLMRLLMMLIITVVVVILHYILEKGIDVI